MQAFGKAYRIILFLLVLFALSFIAYSQTTKLEYRIIRKSNEIGSLVFTRDQLAGKTVLKIESIIKTRFVFLVSINAIEESIYENGIMVSSYLYRKMNGSEKLNKKTWLDGQQYVINKGHHYELFKTYPIHFNLICLYQQEPQYVYNVYSDNFQKFLPVQKLGDHHYRVDFPDGNYNEYYYINGICARVEAHHGLYQVTMQLKNK